MTKKYFLRYPYRPAAFMRQTIFLIVASCAFFRVSAKENEIQLRNNVADTSVAIPLGGNAFIRQGTEYGAKITRQGLTDWTDPKTVTSIYFGVQHPGTVSLALKLRLPAGSRNCNIQITIRKKTYRISLDNHSGDSVHITRLSVTEPGYLRVDLQGTAKTGSAFAVVSSLLVSGGAAVRQLAYVAEARDFHFGRRGPSVHWNFQVPDSLKNRVAYFYNEIYVPRGQDVTGSYFEADGFAYGYFGMQVNSATERRVLFSVWSPFTTDHPEQIPADKRIQLIKKGPDVHGGEFGGEGSGGQSYLSYPWKAGLHYAFLLKAAPDSASKTTIFTAYFKQADARDWHLIAAFRRPNTVSGLDHLYSFLENFQPSMGNVTRRGYYTNQWVRSFDGRWTPIQKAVFTTDATGNAGQRLDYTGGIDSRGFFLENCGFFDGDGPKRRKQVFLRPKDQASLPPAVDFNHLP